MTAARRFPAAAIACGFILPPTAHETRAAHPAALVEIVLHVPYPMSGPQDIQSSDRASRSCRAIAARTAPPVTDTMAAMVEAALWTGAQIKTTRTRRTTPDVLAPHVPPGDPTKPAEPDLILAGDDILRASLAAGRPATARGAPGVVEPIAEMPYVLGCITRPCRQLAVTVPGERKLSSLHLRSLGIAGELGGSAVAGREWIALTRSKPLLVPYAGGNGIVGDLVADRIEASFLALPLALRHLGQTKLHALGIASARRLVALPALPTLAEAGTPLVFESWFAVFGSTHLSAAATRRLQAALRAYRTEDATREEFHRIGLVPSGATPTGIAQRIEAEQARLNRPAPLIP